MHPQLLPSLEPTYLLLKNALQNEVVFVQGPPSTGKSTLVKKVFDEDLKDIYLSAYVDCYSVASQPRLLSIICRAYAANLNITKSEKCKLKLPDYDEQVSISDFPRIIDEYHNLAFKKGFKSLYVILDNVEIFEKTNMMESFVALARIVFQDLHKLKLVIISQETLSDIHNYMTEKSVPIGNSFRDRAQVLSCRVWPKEETINWILRLPPKHEELHHLYDKFVRNVVTLVYNSDSKDPRHIRKYCQQNFADFLLHHKNELKNHIRRLLKIDPNEPLDDKICDEYQLSEHFDTMAVKSFLCTQRAMTDKRRSLYRWTHEDSDIKMTLNTSCLIVAVYLAAYTKLSDDKWNFASYQKKKVPKIRTNSLLNMNKPFTLERALQIYIHLQKKSVGERKLNIINNNDSTLADIERLENLNILHHQSGYELSSEARYKLSPNIKRAYVERLAKHVNLDLDWFKGV